MNKKNKKGFTLVELLVVITIMGVMGTLLVTNYTKYVDKTRQMVVDQQLDEIVKTFEIAFLEGTSYNGKTLIGFKEIETEKLDAKTVYQTLVNKALPEGSTLIMTAGKMKYTCNGKSAIYSYE